MLVVKVEIWPGGDASRVREIARVFATNTTNLADVSNYHIQAEEFGNDWLEIPSSYKTLDIEGHNRNSSVFNLLAKIFSKCKNNDN